jgi:ubiquinone biosynthesis protein COQ9
MPNHTNSDNRTNIRLDATEELRHAILDDMLAEAAFDGWTDTALKQAAKQAGMSAEELARGDLHLAFPKGIADVLDFWAEREDIRMAEAFATADPAPTKIRDKVRFLVHARIAGLAPHREAARRASAMLALPPYAPLATRLTWRTADAIWRALGDGSTDFNFYTKRTTLSAVYLSTLTKWFADDSEDFTATWTFLEKRIENVMQFEKVKAKVSGKLPKGDDIFGFLAKMRYAKK